MKNWKKRWIEELDSKIPELSESLKAEKPSTQIKTSARKFNFNKIIGAVAGCAAAVAVSVGSVAIYNVSAAPQGDVFAVEINPAVCVTADKSGIVTGVMALNTDADVILSKDEFSKSLVGKSFSEAVGLYVEKAAKLGYLNVVEYGDAVKISAYDSKTAVKTLEQSVQAVQNYFIDNGFYSVVVDDVVTKEEFCTLTGFSQDKSVKDVINFICEEQDLFGEREVSGKTQAEIATVYENLYVNDRIKNFIKEELLSISYDLEEILNFIANFSAESFAEYADKVAQALINKGIDVNFSELLNAPLTAEEYNQKIKQTYFAEYENRIAKYSHHFENTQALSKESYQNFINGITKKYGSLENYWDNIKK